MRALPLYGGTLSTIGRRSSVVLVGAGMFEIAARSCLCKSQKSRLEAIRAFMVPETNYLYVGGLDFHVW